MYEFRSRKFVSVSKLPFLDVRCTNGPETVTSRVSEWGRRRTLLLLQFLFGNLHCTLLVKSPKISTMFVHNHKINNEINKILSNYNLSLENADCFVFLFHHVPYDLGPCCF